MSLGTTPADKSKQFTNAEQRTIEEIEVVLAPMPPPMRNNTLRMVCEQQRMQCLARGEVRNARAFARRAALFAARVARVVRAAPIRHVNRHARSQRRVGVARVAAKTTASTGDPDSSSSEPPRHSNAVKEGKFPSFGGAS